MYHSSVYLLLACFAASISAHGHVHYHVLGTKTYTGFLPTATPIFTNPPPSIVRRIGGDGPVQDLSSTALACNFNATPIADGAVSRTGSIAAGANLTFDWHADFPHAGPILTYLARCAPDCGHFDGSAGEVWFKIDEAGYEASTAAFATQRLFNQGNKWSVTIPECLAPGEYLIRHEIIALSNCAKEGQCQFYPSCAQLSILGSGTTVPSTGLVAFPGEYTFANVKWDTNTQAAKDYKTPGPAVFRCPS